MIFYVTWSMSLPRYFVYNNSLLICMYIKIKVCMFYKEFYSSQRTCTKFTMNILQHLKKSFIGILHYTQMR